MSKDRHRSYCFTTNNYSFNDVVRLAALKADYLVVGAERGESGTPHLQGFFQLQNGKSFSRVREMLPGSHIIVANGTAKQNREYCTKQGDFYERGRLPEPGHRSDLAEVRDMVKRGRRMGEVLEVCTSYQSAKFAEMLVKYSPPPPRPTVFVTWIYGPSGTGKSTSAYEIAGQSSYPKPGGKWWDGYDGQTDVIWDDYRGDNYPASDLYRLLQPYPVRVEIKGTSAYCAATNFIFTSIFAPWDLYPTEDKIQLIRRINHLIYFDRDPAKISIAKQEAHTWIARSPQKPLFSIEKITW